MATNIPDASEPAEDDLEREGGPAAGDSGELDWDDLLSHLAEQTPQEGWVALDEAASAAGVARSTLRSWYRSGQVPSRMVPGATGRNAWCRSTPSSTERCGLRVCAASSSVPARSRLRSTSYAGAWTPSSATWAFRDPRAFVTPVLCNTVACDAAVPGF